MARHFIPSPARRYPASGAFVAGLLAAACAAPGPRPDLDWPLPRHDARLTARTSLKGDLTTAPRIAWTFDLGADVHYAVLGADAAPVSARPLPSSAAYLESVEGRTWTRVHARDGAQKDASGPGKTARLIAERDGPQEVEWVPVPGAAHNTRQAVCFTRTEGARREEWRSEPFDVIENSNSIFADVDGDGTLEVVLAPHFRVIVLDGRTGRTRHVHRIHDFRNYGFFCAVNLDDDPFLEFVVVADFAMHMDVVDNDGKQLSTLWRHDFEMDILSKRRIVRAGPSPVQDLDGDGRKEIVFNYFNEFDDSEWHLAAYDALTGKKAFDLPKTYLHGISDIDADGRPELFCAATSSLLVPASGTLRVYRVLEGDPVPCWDHPSGRWLTQKRVMAVTHTTITAQGDYDLVRVPGPGAAGGRILFVEPAASADGARTERLVALAPAVEGAFTTVARAEFPAARCSPAAVAGYRGRADGEADLLVALRGAVPAPLTAVARDRLPVEMKQVAVVRDGGRPVVLVESARREILCLVPPSAPGAGPAVRWRRPGVGPALAADTDGDGRPEAVFATQSESGEGRITAVSLDGREVWSRPLTGFPGPRPLWNFGGVTTWWVGRYSDPARHDVWVSTRRGTMHTDEGWVFTSTAPGPLWRRREVRTDQTPSDKRGFGCGGSKVCSCDADGDGLDDVISLYPVNYMAARGTDGTMIRSISAESGLFEGVWGAYASPVVADLDGDGAAEILWSGSYHLGLTTLDGRRRWHHAGSFGPATAADLDGDGTLEVAAATGTRDATSARWAPDSRLRIVDAVTGADRGALPLGAPAALEIAAADIDGDGADELIYAIGRTVYAVNAKRGTPAVLWEVRLPDAPAPDPIRQDFWPATVPAPASETAIADVDGDGRAEILLVGEDSVLYCLDGRGN